jgi:DNA-binding transcriptional ArsR family regulator
MARVQGKALEDARRIALLASPARIELVDTLEALGGSATVAELAAQLGRPADGLYYHLRQLAAGGLVDEEESDGGRRYRVRASGNGRLRLRYRPGATANARAVGQVAGSVLRVAGRDFEAALADPKTVAEGPARELWVARGKGWVGAAELTEINTLLTRLSTLLQQPRSPRRQRLVALSWVLAPVDAKPARRSGGTAQARPRTSRVDDGRR